MDPEGVRGMPGVVEAVPVPGGAAVVAESWWRAKRAADTLDVEFHGGAEGVGNPEMEGEVVEALDREDVPMTLERGGLKAAFAGAAQVVEADCAVPMLDYACMGR